MKKQHYLFISTLLFLAPSLLLASDLNPLLQTSTKYTSIRVAKVQAVDRFLLENDEKIALIGVRGPVPPKREELRRDEHGFIVRDEDPTTPFELEALRAVRQLVEGRPVRLEFDTQRRDVNGNILVYVVLLDGRLLNAELLRLGYADLQIAPPNLKYADKLRAAYQEARREMRGMQGAW